MEENNNFLKLIIQKFKESNIQNLNDVLTLGYAIKPNEGEYVLTIEISDKDLEGIDLATDLKELENRHKSWQDIPNNSQILVGFIYAHQFTGDKVIIGILEKYLNEIIKKVNL